MRRRRTNGVLDRPMIRHKRPFPYAKFPREDQLDISYKKFKNAMEHPGHIIEEVWFKGIIGELIDELQKDIGWSQLVAKDGIIEQLESQLTAASERERMLVEAAEIVVRGVKNWNDCVESIIGRQPNANLFLSDLEQAIAAAKGTP